MGPRDCHKDSREKQDHPNISRGSGTQTGPEGHRNVLKLFQNIVHECIYDLVCGMVTGQILHVANLERKMASRRKITIIIS